MKLDPSCKRWVRAFSFLILFLWGPFSLAETFQQSGYIVLPASMAFQQPEGVWVGSDKKLLVANSFNNDIAVTRLGSDGSLDPAFGTHGTTTLSGFVHIVAVVTRADGSLLIGGTVHTGGDDDFALARLTAQGTFDPGFGTGGRVSTDLNFGSDDDAFAMRIQSDGKILLAGRSTNTGKSTFALVQYLPDGELDTDYGEAGILFAPTRSSNALIFDPQGKMLSAIVDKTDLVVERLNADGTPDTAFAGGTKPRIHVDQISLYTSNILLQADQKILVVAANLNPIGAPAGKEAAIARFNPDGSVDTNFGQKGIVLSGLFPGQSQSALFDPQGNLLFCGTDFTSFAPYLTRLKADGSVDTSFGQRGQTSFPFLRFANNMGSVAVQADGKILVQGTTQDPQSNQFESFAARFLADGQLDSGTGSAR